MSKAKENIGLLEAISIGIGGMVGGGIFAVLGLAVSLAKGGTPVAFLAAGIIALVTAYSYSKMSLKYPDRGGTVKFINVGFGRGLFSGGLNNLLWVSYIVMLSLYASAFGSYAANIMSLTGSKTIDVHLFLSLIILIATGVNYYSIKFVGEIESFAVGLKLLILCAFILIAGYSTLQSENLFQLLPTSWNSPISLITGGMVIFVAYEGFELIANVSPDIINREKNIPRAYFISVASVVALYIVIALITVGSLSFSDIAKAKDYVLAEASRPVLGQTGFLIMSIAALISTFSALNATLYGGSRVSYELAEDDEAPHELTKYFWNKPLGLAISSVLTLVLANALDLESISTSGSMGFLLVFMMVNLSAWRCSRDLHSLGWIHALGTLLCFTSLIALCIQQLRTNTIGALVALSLIVICFGMEFWFKRWEKTNS